MRVIPGIGTLAHARRLQLQFRQLTRSLLALTKSELIEQISETLNLPNGRAEQIVNCVFDSMIHALQEGDGIEIRGFGSFTIRDYQAYEGRNPRTGEAVHVKPKRLAFFKVGKELRERVNQGAEAAGPPKAGGHESTSGTGGDGAPQEPRGF